MKLKFWSKKKQKTDLEKVAERREQVLSRGRKFKYPLQYTKHRIVMNTILISSIMFAIILLLGYLALYQFKMTDDILYYSSRVLPVPVASVDGEYALFSDYLLFYRSAIASIENQSTSSSEDSQASDLKTQYKRSALDEAERYAYAIKLAKANNITVSKEEITSEFNRHRQVGGVDRSEEGFLKILKDNFGLTKDEYERMLYLILIKAKVEAAIDETASATATELENILVANNNNFTDAKSQLGDKIIYESTGELIDNKNVDGGRASKATTLAVGAVSEQFVSLNGDGYYYVKLIAKTESKVNFESLKITFTEFNTRFNSLKDENKIQEFITL